MTRSIAAALVVLVVGASCTPGEDVEVPARPDVVCEGCPAGGAVDFGTPLVGERVDRVVTLRNRGDAPALLREIQASSVPPGFSVRPSCTTGCGLHELAPGRALELAITYRPTEEGPAEATLALGPDGPDLRLVGHGGLIACAALDFGTVVRGQQRSLALDCENTTDGVRQISFGAAIGENAGEFQVEAAALDLAPLGRASTAVVFAPAGMVGPREVRLPILVGAESIGEVGLKGIAVNGALQVPAAGAACVDWGFQLLGTRHEHAIEVMNVTHEAVPVIARVGGDDSGFSTSREPFLLEPGGRILIAFAFEPQEAGAAAADLLIESGDEVHRICARGTGVGPTLSCDRSEVDFGLADVATPRSTRLHCTNAAEEVAGTELDRLVVQGVNSASFAVVEPAGRPATGYAPGEAFELEVRFQPATVGVHAAELTTSDHRGTIPLQGEARSWPGCTLDAATSYDFGRVAGDAARHPFFLTNTGSGTCLVGDFVVAGGDRFSVEPAFGSREIGPGQTAVVELLFAKGDSAGRVEGELAFWASDAAAPQRTVALQAYAGDACLDVYPSSLELPAVAPFCGQPTLDLHLRNACPDPLSILSAEIVGHTDAFTMGDATLTLPGWAQESVQVGARATGRAQNRASIRITTDAFPEPIVIPLRADGISDGRFVETRTIARPALDILFVIEDSAAQSPHFWLDAETIFAGLAGIDWQIGATTTSVGDSDTSGRLVPLDGSPRRFVTPALPEAERIAAFYASVTVGHLGSTTEMPLKAMQLALSSPLIDHADDLRTLIPNDGNRGFLRSHADLAVVFIIEEPDMSQGDAASYVDFLVGLKRGAATARMHLVPQAAHAYPYTRLRHVVSATGGTEFDYMNMHPFDAFNAAMIATIVPEPVRCFPLRHTPFGPPDGPSVSLDGIDLPASDPAYPWRYEQATNEVCFSAAAPPVGSEVEITYQLACN